LAKAKLSNEPVQLDAVLVLPVDSPYNSTYSVVATPVNFKVNATAAAR
jgi:hypothetical protein